MREARAQGDRRRGRRPRIAVRGFSAAHALLFVLPGKALAWQSRVEVYVVSPRRSRSRSRSSLTHARRRWPSHHPQPVLGLCTPLVTLGLSTVECWQPHSCRPAGSPNMRRLRSGCGLFDDGGFAWLTLVERRTARAGLRRPPTTMTSLPSSTRLSGSQVIAQSLKAQGVTHIFGIVGIPVGRVSADDGLARSLSPATRIAGASRLRGLTTSILRQSLVRSLMSRSLR